MDHTDAIRALDRLRREADILQQMRDKPITGATAPAHAAQMLAQAKRVRSAVTLCVRHLAVLRDSYSLEGGTSE